MGVHFMFDNYQIMFIKHDIHSTLNIDRNGLDFICTSPACSHLSPNTHLRLDTHIRFKVVVVHVQRRLSVVMRSTRGQRNRVGSNPHRAIGITVRTDSEDTGGAAREQCAAGATIICKAAVQWEVREGTGWAGGGARGWSVEKPLKSSGMGYTHNMI